MPDPTTIDIPEHFETARLELRPFELQHAQALHEALAESINELRETLWFLPWVAEPPTLASARERCRKAAANFLLRADLPYLAFDKSSGRLVASAGLHRTQWELPRTEVGYWVRSSEVGKGYASEAVQALVAWALGSLGAQRVELVTDELNAGSRRVAERCGFELEAVLRHTMRAPDGGLRNSCIYARLPSTSSTTPAVTTPAASHSPLLMTSPPSVAPSAMPITGLTKA
jgi:RimJ/RimL family protein N-acetyltransferase